jgi:tripartite-type tricarboxylate transporter receptor subunit TctC
MVPASAQDSGTYPDRPVRIIVPLAPGGSVDLVARITAEALTAAMGKSFIVENLGGGGGTVGTGVASKAKPDGYTLVVGSSSTFGVNPSLMKNLPYDAKKDFEPVSLISFAPNVLVVPKTLPVSTVGEFVALAKSKPGEMSFASSGTGGSPHLAGELFTREAGIDLIHIPYKSSGQSMTDLLGGRVDMSFSTLIATQEQITAGGLKALAVTTSERVESLPDVPTMAEAGFPAVRITAWNGLLAPAGTPDAIVKKLSAAVQSAMRSPEVVEKLKRDGAKPVGSTPEEFKVYIAEEIAKWAQVIKAANITVE